MALLKASLVEVCEDLRPHVIPLTDAIGHPDWILKAPFGAYDGDIYRRYIETIKRAPGGRPGPTSYWNEHIRPLTASTAAKL